MTNEQEKQQWEKVTNGIIKICKEVNDQLSETQITVMSGALAVWFDSIAKQSSQSIIDAQAQDTETLKRKLAELQRENAELRKNAERLKSIVFAAKAVTKLKDGGTAQASAIRMLRNKFEDAATARAEQNENQAATCAKGSA